MLSGRARILPVTMSTPETIARGAYDVCAAMSVADIAFGRRYI